jgi:ribosomal protein L11 methyltransferase
MADISRSRRLTPNSSFAIRHSSFAVHPSSWPGFEILGPANLLDAAEFAVCAVLDESDLLGTARVTWLDPRYAPAGEIAHAANAASAHLDPTQDYPAASPSAPVGEVNCLSVYLSPQADAAQCGRLLEEALRTAFPDAQDAGRLRLRPISLPDADWATLWRELFRPIRVSSRLLVLPAWWDEAHARREAAPLAEDAILLRIQPGGAFGSGTHATTQLALRMLESAVAPGDRVLDFGAGSGILSFAAAALGAESVVCVETDPESLPNFEENLRLNPSPGGTGRIAYRVGSSERIGADETFRVIACNALFRNVSPHFELLLRHLIPGGVFLYSGFLLSEREEVVSYLRGLGWTLSDFVSQEEWGGVAFSRIA